MTVGQSDPRTSVLDKVKELPPLPRAVQKLMAVMRDPECTVDDIAAVLGTDQALAGRILRLVNSSFFGMSGSVSTISQAVVILGHAPLRSVATGLAVADAVGRMLPTNRRREFWQHSLAAAAAAEIIARRKALPDPEEAFVAGLLHDIGHIVLMLALPAEYSAAVAAQALGDIAKERGIIGLDHGRAGRMLLRHWKLPECHQDAAWMHHGNRSGTAPDRAFTDIIALADRLARIFGANAENDAANADLLELAGSLGLSPRDLAAIVPDVAERLSVARALVGPNDVGPSPAPLADGTLRVAVIADDEARRTWISLLAQAHGGLVVDGRDHLADPVGCPADLVILDAGSVGPESAERLATSAAADSIRHATIASSGNASSGSPATSGTVIPLAFSAGDLRLG